MESDFDSAVGRFVREFSLMHETLSLLAVALTRPPGIEASDDASHYWFFERIALVAREIDAGRLVGALIPTLLKDPDTDQALKDGWKRVVGRANGIISTRNALMHSTLPTVTLVLADGSVHQEVIVDRRGQFDSPRLSAKDIAESADKCEAVREEVGGLLDLAYGPPPQPAKESAT